MKLGYFVFIVFSLLVAVFLKPERISNFDAKVNFTFTLIAIANIIVFLRYTSRRFSWMNFGVLFTIGFLIVHFQIPFLASVGIDPEKPKLIWTNKWVVNYATWLSLIALLLWILGYCGFQKSINHQVDVKKKHVDTKKLNFFLVFVFIIFLLLVGNDFLVGNYNGGANWGSGSMYLFVILRVVLCLKIFYFFYNNETFCVNSFIRNRIFIFILIVYILVFLNAGDRGPFMELLIVSVCSYTIFNGKILLKTFVFGVIISAFFLNMIKYGRTSDVSNRNENIVVTGFNNFLKQETINPTDELASSNRILFLALDKVPDNHPYLSGLTFFHEIIGCVPFGMFIYIKFSGMPEFYFSTSRFFTIMRQGKYYGSGDGSEIIADIYVNFGIYGVFVLMFLFGIFISYIQFYALVLNKHNYLIIYIFLMISALYINRSSFLDPLKTIIYGLIIDYILIKNK